MQFVDSFINIKKTWKQKYCTVDKLLNLNNIDKDF